MAECQLIPIEYKCLNVGESTLDELFTSDFDLTGAKIEAQFRLGLNSGLVFSYTTEGTDPPIEVLTSNTFVRHGRQFNYAPGTYYGDWWFTLPGGEPFLYFRTEFTINGSYTKNP